MPATHAILSSRVEFTTEVTRIDVELGLVDETSHHVGFAIGEQLHALDGALGHEAGAVTLLGAVGDDIALRRADVGHLGRGPETEVCQAKHREKHTTRPRRRHDAAPKTGAGVEKTLH